MRKLICLIFFLIPVFLSAQSEIPYGKWEVIAAPDSMASPEIVRALNPYIGECLTIKKNKFKSFFRKVGEPPLLLGKAKCKAPQYEVELQPAEKFFYFVGETLLQYDRAGEKEVSVFTVVCTDAPGEIGGTFYLLRDDLILLSYLGLNVYLKKK